MTFRIGFVFDTGRTESTVFEGSTLDGAKLYASYYVKNKGHLGTVAASVVRALDDDGNMIGVPFIYRGNIKE